MKTKKMIAILLLTLGILPLAVASWGGEPSGEKGTTSICMPPIARLIAGKIGRLLVLRSELKVTDAQRQKIAEVVKSHRQEIQPKVKAILEKKRALREAVVFKPADEQTIRKAAEDLGKAIGDAAVVASRVIGEAKGALTAGQLARIHQFRTSCDQAETGWLNQIGQ